MPCARTRTPFLGVQESIDAENRPGTVRCTHLVQHHVKGTGSLGKHVSDMCSSSVYKILLDDSVAFSRLPQPGASTDRDVRNSSYSDGGGGVNSKSRKKSASQNTRYHQPICGKLESLG